MDEYGHAREIAGKYGVSEETTLRMIRAEAHEEMTRLKGSRPKYGATIDVVAELVKMWIETAHEYAVDTSDLEDLARFVASHRRACVWAVLVGKARAVPNVRPAEER